MYYTTAHPSPLGVLTLASDGDSLVGLWMHGQKYFGSGLRASMVEQDGLPVFRAARRWLDSYFEGKRPDPATLPLAPIGSDFRQQVWQILRAIPYGQVVTYGEIAREMAARMGRPSMSSQAVGGAVGYNPLSILIPCHRVVGADGSLTGYAGGIPAKIKLLQLEGVDTARFSCNNQELRLVGEKSS